MDDIDHPSLIEEWKQNLDAAAYLKKNQDVKLPSKKKKIESNDKTEYWPTSRGSSPDLSLKLHFNSFSYLLISAEKNYSEQIDVDKSQRQ